MSGFLYSVFLKLLYPTSIALALFVAAAIFRRHGFTVLQD